MSQKTIENVKKEKGFRIFDLIVYGVIVLIVAVSFIAVFATKDKSPLTGIRVYVEDKAVFEYDFESGNYNIFKTDGYEIEVSDKGKKVKITTEYGYNLIVIDKKGSVRIKDADCHGHDCVYSPAITDNNGIIYCSPHRLKITPFNFDDGKVTM